jgi:HD-GYP domain-containing protein (c-di-GMP phosphodiesterase class II)
LANPTQSSIKIYVLCVGLEDFAKELLKDTLALAEVIFLTFDLDKLMEPLTNAPHLILCGPPTKDISIVEMGQMLSMQYKRVPLYFAAIDRVGYDRKEFVKNGFTDAYLLPMDLDVLQANAKDYFSKIANGEIKSYRAVKLLDIEPGVVLDFDTTIYLPSNNRYIKYSSAGDPIEKERLEKLNQHKMSSVYVTVDQMPKFYAFTASQLKQSASSDKLSATERKEKTEGAVRELVSGLFSTNVKEATFDHGQELLKDCREIVNSFISETSSAEWHKRLLATMGEISSSYGHAANVSTYAALFSIGLQIGNPSDLATAGLLHDLGEGNVPAEIVAKKEEDRTKEEQALYQKHPEYTLDILMQKKLILTEPISKAILQHHENYNGTGYPHQYVGSRISREAQILALADKFDELTSAAEGKPLMSPREAIEYFKGQVAKDAKKMIFDPELLRNLLRLFPN